jgi:RNA polymerase sigma-70 factor (ECF subfamily)
MTDADLLARARAGDAAAREAILVRHAPAVLRWARAICRGPDGEDIAQDVLVTAAKGLDGVRDGEAIEAWLRTVTRNTCARRRRRRAGAPAVHEEVDDALAGEAPGPDESAERSELRALVQGAIGALDEKYRTILVLRDVEGLTAPEVAELTGLEVAAVKTRLHRARAALRDLVAPSVRRRGCPELGVTYSRYLEGELDRAACDALEAHVSTCAHCAPACEALRSAIGACRRVEAPPPDVVARVRAALRAAAAGGA